MFEIIKEVDRNIVNINKLNATKHVLERLYRVRFNKKYLNNNNIYKSFLVNTNHSNGLELHIILKDATVLILNNNTKKLVTILNTRKNQLLRYDKKVPKYIIRQAIENQQMKRNY